jgi:hypothetical protein
VVSMAKESISGTYSVVFYIYNLGPTVVLICCSFTKKRMRLV